MRSHGRRCAIFSASFSTLFSLAAASVHAQPAFTNTAQPAFNNTAQPALNAPFNDSVSSAAMPMPQLQMPSTEAAIAAAPPAQMPVAPALGESGNGNNSFIRPAAFNQFSSPGGPMQATDVQHPQAQLRDAPGSGSVMPPGTGYGAQPGYAAQPGYGAQPGYRNTAMQQPAYPQAFPNQQQSLQQQQLQQQYWQQQQLQQQLQQQQMQQQLPAAQLRNQAGTVPSTQALGGGQMPVMTGDPRFVSQPPVQRPGNFPTSPYRGQYRTVAYQLPQQSPPVLPVQAPSAIANQPQVLPPTSGLPQFQATTGVAQGPLATNTAPGYLASYQALQPGYNCAPGIPSNGVPAYVPGAVAPPTLPPNLTPQLYTPDNAGYRPLFSLGQENYNVQLGRGIIGQPTVYVAGQPIRNFLRYLSP